eukprot:1856069-Alexandrium_andersonii.AAC.1
MSSTVSGHPPETETETTASVQSKCALEAWSRAVLPFARACEEADTPACQTLEHRCISLVSSTDADDNSMH